MSNQKDKILYILSSKVFTVFLIGLFFVITTGIYEDYTRRQQFDQEIKNLEKKIEELEGKKTELSKLIDVLSSQRYIEKEARIRFGLKKRGEKVISVPDNVKKQAIAGQDEVYTVKPNYKMWIEYFFNK